MRDERYSQLLEAHATLEQNRSGREFPIQLLSNVEVSQLRELLEVSLLREKINAVVSVGNFDNFLQDSLNVRNEDVVVVFWELSKVHEHIAVDIETWPGERIEELFEHLVACLNTFLKNISKCRAVFFNQFSAATFSSRSLSQTTLERLAERLNSYLEQNSPLNVWLVNMEKIYMQAGIEKMASWRNFYAASAPYSIQFMREYVDYVGPKLREIAGKTRKVLIMDCDNTLWSGIVGEDGVDNISMSGPAMPGVVFAAIQREIIVLKRRGVILAICSKNNQEDVEDVFRTRGDMMIRMTDISAKQINWSDKVENIEKIREELNVGLDSIVFVDDSDYEVESVKARLPSVKVYKVPTSLEEYPSLMREVAREFVRSSTTHEDERRAEMYQEQKLREKTRSDFADLHEYLASLGLKVAIQKDAEESVGRIAQLCQRTNQFNLTNTRYTEQEVMGFMNSEDYDVLSLSASDKFGDYGITGVALIEYRDDRESALIQSFLLSCRIIGRDIELAFVNFIMKMLRKVGVKTVFARYAASDRNRQVSDFFQSLGFSVVETDGDNKQYEINLQKYKPSKLDYIEVCDGD